MAAGPVVVQGATLTCSHPGTAATQTGSTRLTVGGKGVVTSGGEIGLTFSDSCVSVLPTTGLATKLTVGKKPVILASSAGPTTNSQLGAGTWSVTSPGQTKLTAV